MPAATLAKYGQARQRSGAGRSCGVADAARTRSPSPDRRGDLRRDRRGGARRHRLDADRLPFGSLLPRNVGGLNLFYLLPFVVTLLSLGARAALLPATRAVAEGALVEGDIPRGSFVLGFLAGFFGGCPALALVFAIVFAIAKGSQTKQGAGMELTAQVILGIVLDGIRR